MFNNPVSTLGGTNNLLTAFYIDSGLSTGAFGTLGDVYVTNESNAGFKFNSLWSTLPTNLDVVGYNDDGASLFTTSSAGRGTTFGNSLVTVSSGLSVTASSGYKLGAANALSYPSQDNTTGGTIAVGNGALVGLSATAANYRSNAFGYQAIGNGTKTTASVDNDAFGFEALYGVTSGNQNIAMGSSAGMSDTSGANNVFLGFNAGYDVSSGGTNTAVGANALVSAFSTALTGSNNTAAGSSALYAVQGAASSNTGLGQKAGYTITTGGQNTIIGAQVGSTILTTGSNNILIGTSATTTTNGAADTNEIAIGGVGLGSNTTEIGLSGTTTATTIYGSLATGAVTATSFAGAGTGLTGTAASLSVGGTAATLSGALSANQLLGSLTAVAPTGQTVPSCSTASSALLWTSGTGFSCNTSVTAAAVPASGLTGTTLASSVVTSSLTAVGTIATGVWSGTALLAAKIPADVAYLDVAQSWTAGQAVTKSTPAISTATFTPNFAASTNFDIGLVHASCPCTLANPSSITAGQSGVIAIIQSATGSDTITTYGTDYVFTNGAPTLSTTASATDYYSYYVEDSTHIRMSFLPATANPSLAGSSGTPTCGTGCASITSGSTNARGSMVSSSSVTSATVNWSGTLSYTPFCTISDSNTSAVMDISALTSSALTVSMASALSAVTIYWICVQ